VHVGYQRGKLLIVELALNWFEGQLGQNIRVALGIMHLEVEFC
jgi:hypothetical protein